MPGPEGGQGPGVVPVQVGGVRVGDVRGRRAGRGDRVGRQHGIVQPGLLQVVHRVLRRVPAQQRVVLIGVAHVHRGRLPVSVHLQTQHND